MDVTKTGKLTHVECEGCIVNIKEGLNDYLGRRVTSIEITPDEQYQGEKWKYVSGKYNHRIIKLKGKYKRSRYEV